MNLEWVEWIVALAAGAALGVFFYGGLWLTIRHLVGTPHPARWWFISFLTRALLTAGGLLWIMNDDWRRLLAALAGVFAVRVLWTWAWSPAPMARERLGPRPAPVIPERKGRQWM